VCIDLVRFPERALEIGPATEILFHGMIAGSFTGAKLADYFHGLHADWQGARRIVNGTDKAALVAGYANAYDKALR
jgi:hypothetical protein